MLRTGHFDIIISNAMCVPWWNKNFKLSKFFNAHTLALIFIHCTRIAVLLLQILALIFKHILALLLLLLVFFVVVVVVILSIITLVFIFTDIKALLLLLLLHFTLVTYFSG